MSLQPIRKHVAPEIPDKLYFRIGDVARLCEVPAYVLRFWETEFPQLRPNKGGTGQRLYRKRDVEMALRIKSLLYDQGYTIPGARQVFKAEGKARELAALEAALPTPAPVGATEEAASGNAPPASSSRQPATEVLEAERAAHRRREAGLRALRDELCALLVILEQPLRSPAEPVESSKPRLQAMRPRLVACEPKTPTPAAETLRLVISRSQGDLFPAE